MSHTVYLALGTNLGDRMVNLAHALVLLTPHATLRNWSRVYETPPWGYLEQPAFFNMVVEAQTDLDPIDLLARLKFLEEKIGRGKSVRYGPRLIDLDILFYDEIEMRTSRLEIPHPRIAERAFVLIPLAELAPTRKLGPGGQTIADLLTRIDPSGISPVTVRESDSPAGLAVMFQKVPEALDRFLGLPPSHQREYLQHILEAKKPATRRKRFDWTVNQLSIKKD
ncbi:MAG: 2-amino-4-hydroxy-6-hydroxymethyldihydropteridine diphosphokinase [Bellilinea sp.]